MSCERIQRRLSAYLEGDLRRGERERVRQHLAGCPACGGELRQLARTAELLRGLSDPEPPAHLAGRVIARLRDGEGGPDALDRLRDWASRLRMPVLSGAAAVLATLAVLRLVAPDPSQQAEALRAALREAPTTAPDLDLDPRFGAAAAPDTAGGLDLDGLLSRAEREPELLVEALRSRPAAERPAFTEELVRRARERGLAPSLADALRDVEREAASLAARLEPPAPD